LSSSRRLSAKHSISVRSAHQAHVLHPVVAFVVRSRACVMFIYEMCHTIYSTSPDPRPPGEMTSDCVGDKRRCTIPGGGVEVTPCRHFFRNIHFPYLPVASRAPDEIRTTPQTPVSPVGAHTTSKRPRRNLGRLDPLLRRALSSHADSTGTHSLLLLIP